MRSALVCVALIAACYQPTLREGAPCGPGETCPTGQECRSGTCYFEGTPADAMGAFDGIDYDAPMVVQADASPDGPSYKPWGTPVENTSLELPQSGEDDPSVTSDRLTVVLMATETVAPISENLFIGKRTMPTGAFTVTALTALNSTTADENSPEISADGKTIYFVSDRVTANDGDVWKSTESGGVWAAPTMDATLSVGNVGDLAISPDGLTAAIARGGTFYIHTRTSITAAWSAGTAHNELTTGVTSVAAPSITNGAATIYFHAQNPRDIFVSHRQSSGTFDTPTPVSELNMLTTRDAAPFVLQTDDYMIFEREYNIYEVTR